MKYHTNPYFASNFSLNILTCSAPISCFLFNFVDYLPHPVNNTLYEHKNVGLPTVAWETNQRPKHPRIIITHLITASRSCVMSRD